VVEEGRLCGIFAERNALTVRYVSMSSTVVR
jgi:hypothetical protein